MFATSGSEVFCKYFIRYLHVKIWGVFDLTVTKLWHPSRGNVWFYVHCVHNWAINPQCERSQRTTVVIKWTSF